MKRKQKGQIQFKQNDAEAQFVLIQLLKLFGGLNESDLCL